MGKVIKGKPTQISIIKEHLLAGEEISPLRGYDLCHTIRLGAIIFDLRNRGMNIINIGKPGGYAIYKLAESEA